MATTGLVTLVAVETIAWHLPLNRQAQAIAEHSQMAHGFRDRNRERVLAVGAMHGGLAK
jgi:transposase